MRNILLIIFALVSVAMGSVDTFKFVSDTLWSTAANWSSGSTPSSTDTVYFTSASNGLCVQDINDTIKSLVFISGHTNTLKRKTSSLYVSGNITYIKTNTVDAGTSSTIITDISTVTTANKADAFYDLTINCADSTKLVTFADTLKTATGGDFTLTQGKATFAGYGIIAGGDVLFNNGWNNYGNFITMNGTNSTLHNESTVGTQTASSCVLTFNSTGHTLDYDKASTFLSLSLAASASLTNSGAATTTFASTGVLFTLGASAALTINNTMNFSKSADGNFYSVGSGSTISGTGASTWLLTASNTDATFPELTWGAGAITIRVSNSITNCTATWTGNAVFGGALQLNSNTATGQIAFDFNDYNITCKTLRIGPSATHTTGYTTYAFGTGTLECNSFGNALDDNAATFNFEQSKVIVSGSLTFCPNWNVTIGTSTVKIDSTGTVTSAGKHFWIFRDSTASTSTVTLADSLQCDSLLDLKAGKFNSSTYNIYTKNYSNTSPDTVKYSGNLILTGNYNRGTPTIVTRTGGAMYFDTVTNRSQTFTANGNQIGPVYCKWLTFLDSAKIQKLTVSDSGTITLPASAGVRIDTIGKLDGSSGKLNRYVSSNPGTQARWWIPGSTTSLYRYWKDINRSGGTTIAKDGTAGTNVNGGNNTNVIFMPGPISYTPATVIDTISKAASHAIAITGTVDSFTVAPTLPGGLSLTKATGTISGTPTTVTAAANYTVTAYNAAGTDSTTINIAVVAAQSATTGRRKTWNFGFGYGFR